MASSPPRLSPSLPLLRTFESAGRHSSFSRAARELSITPSAVSQQMRLLEDRLGVDLFVRGPRDVRLTSKGVRLAEDVATALSALDRAVTLLDDEAVAGPLVVSMGSFATEWITPRLAGFRWRHPAVSVLITAESRTVDLRNQEADLAIRYGQGEYPGLWSEFLMADQVYPVCAPDMAMRQDRWTLSEAMRAMPLIHDVSIGGDDTSLSWQRWAKEIRLDIQAPGLLFGDSILALRSALHGEGLMLGRDSIVGAHVEACRLVRPVDEHRTTEGAYYVVAPPGGPKGAAAAFCRWLKDMLANTEINAASLTQSLKSS